MDESGHRYIDVIVTRRVVVSLDWDGRIDVADTALELRICDRATFADVNVFRDVLRRAVIKCAATIACDEIDACGDTATLEITIDAATIAAHSGFSAKRAIDLNNVGLVVCEETIDIATFAADDEDFLTRGQRSIDFGTIDGAAQTTVEKPKSTYARCYNCRAARCCRGDAINIASRAAICAEAVAAVSSDNAV